MIGIIISSSFLIILIILLRVLLKGKISVRLQYALWFLVLIRLLVPINFSHTTYSIINIVNTTRTVVKSNDSIPAQITKNESKPKIVTEDNYSNKNTVNSSPIQDIKPIISNQANNTAIKKNADVVINAKPKAWSVSLVLTLIWITGMIVIGICMISTNLVFYLRLQRARKHHTITQCKLPVYVIETLSSPCLIGIIRPAIYLTPEVMADETMLEFALTHEHTHYAHFDHIWSFLRMACLVIHWYNPLVWFAAILSKRDAELACDEGTIRKIGEERRLEYARSLIDMIKVQSKPGDLLSLAMPMSSGKRSLKDRILHISKKPKRVLPITILVLVIVVVGVGCAFTGSKKEVNSKENFTPTVVPTIDKPISTVKPTEETPISTVIPTATMQPISNDNKIETKDDENSVTPKKYTQLKKTYYKITNNKLLISYDGKSYIDTQVEISQEMSTTFTSDNLFISDKITAVVVAKDTTADIYVSNNKWKTWSKVTLYSKEKDPFITVPTYNSSTVSFVNAFIGFSTNLNGWIAFGGEVAMGNENNFVFQTTDGGKTWHEVSNSSNAYARVLTGACYTTSETGFLCFRYDVSTHGPIYSTNDGGKTWKELHIKYPIKYANIELTPVSPRFNGKYGIIPMCNTDYVDYNSIVFYLYTKDGGKTWSYNMPD